MNKHLRTFLSGVVILLGCVLMIGGIITGKHGATVGGIIIAGVAAQQLMAFRKSMTKNGT